MGGLSYPIKAVSRSHSLTAETKTLHELDNKRDVSGGDGGSFQQHQPRRAELPLPQHHLRQLHADRHVLGHKA